MFRTIARRLLGIVCGGAVFFVSAGSLAGEPTGLIIIDEISIYYTISPADMIREYPKGSSLREMHGGPPQGKHVHHLMVALFDSDKRQPITDAKVIAQVSNVGLQETTKELEPMTLGNAHTFGNYFDFSDSGKYKVDLEVQMLGAGKTIQASFEHKH